MDKYSQKKQLVALLKQMLEMQIEEQKIVREMLTLLLAEEQINTTH